jgi:hypothetical protein
MTNAKKTHTNSLHCLKTEANVISASKNQQYKKHQKTIMLAMLQGK